MYIMLIAALCVAVALDYEQNTLVGLTWILEQLCKMQSWQDNHFLDEETEVPSHAELSVVFLCSETFTNQCG